VLYDDGRERVVNVESNNGFEAHKTALLPRADMDWVLPISAELVRNPNRPGEEKRKHSVIVAISDAAELVEKDLRQRGELVDGLARIGYRVGEREAEIVFSQWRDD
jgi:hypothetical protein